MRKLSQKELLHESFGSIMRGIGRVSKQAVKGAAKQLMPQTTRNISAISKAFKNIRSGNPVSAVKIILKGRSGKRYFRDVKVDKAVSLPNGDFKIPIVSGVFMTNLGGGNIKDTDLTGGFFIVRQDEKPDDGGFENEIIEIHDKNGLVTKNLSGLSHVSQQTNQNDQFYLKLNAWVRANIGQNAVGGNINGDQMKQFLTSLRGVKDPDAILAGVGLTTNDYNKILNKKQLDGIGSALIARNIAL